MKSRLMIVACVAVLAAFSWVRAEDKPAPDAEKKPAPRLMSPYSRISSLTDEQKTKLRDIRVKATDDMRKIQEQMKSDMLAVLTDAQKEELKALMEKAPPANVKKKDAPEATEAPAEKK